jgi:DNA (cytosine-5)-methyltransferase 1
VVEGMRMKLRVLDLFSGIGGFSLGLERTKGFETIAFCEIDPFCQKVLKKHWPNVPCFQDITKLGESDLHELGQIDVICGGFPCQDISCAGKGTGIHAERSGLWWEMLRIIRLVGPKYVLVENVAALVNRGLDEILGSLAESGYDAEWQVLRASDFGLNHRRERLFLVAYNVRFRRDCGRIFKSINAEEHNRKRSSIDFCQPDDINGRRYCLPTGDFRRCDVVSERMDRLRSLGNAIVPQCAQYVGQCLLDAIGDG